MTFNTDEVAENARLAAHSKLEKREEDQEENDDGYELIRYKFECNT